MLLFVYTTTRKRFVIFTCRYFKLSRNTTALSRSNCRNFSCSSITVKILFAISSLYNKLNELTIFVLQLFRERLSDKVHVLSVAAVCRIHKSFLQNASKRVPWLLPLHWLHTARWKTRTGLDWIGVQSPVQLFHLVGYTPVPVHPPHLLQYAAFLARSLKPSSIRTYLNIIGFLHKEFWLPHPLLNNWPFKSLLIGIKRAVGTPLNQKITYNCWNVVEDSYDFTLSLDSSSFVSFYGMFRKAHLLPTSPGKFDSSKQLTKAEFRFFPWGTSLSFAGERLFSFVNGWSKSLRPLYSP